LEDQRRGQQYLSSEGEIGDGTDESGQLVRRAFLYNYVNIDILEVEMDDGKKGRCTFTNFLGKGVCQLKTSWYA
jgi:hypothetical protein